MNSIRRHMVLGMLGGTTVLLGITGLALYLYAQTVLEAEFDAALRAKAMALVTLTDWDRGKVELNFADAFMPEYTRRERPDYFQVWHHDGSTLERSGSLGTNDLAQHTGTLAVPVYWDLRLPDGRPGRAVGVRFTAQRDLEADAKSPETAGIPASSVALVVARERARLDQALTALRVASVLVVTLLLAVMTSLVTIVVRRGLNPLARVGEQAAAIDAASLQVRFSTNAMPVELRPICEGLNDLLARLEKAFQRERRISADIAHELRTPLAELRTHVEVALKWPEGHEDTDETLRGVLAIVGRMEAMMTGLLALARSEDGKLSIHPEPVALSGLVAEIWSPLAAKAERKQLNLALNVSPELVVHTDPALLRPILGNLLGNAVDYSPAGGPVHIHATTHNGQFEFNVDNTSDNLDPDDLPHLCERFWRKDTARTDSCHAGLGLTLAQSLATVLGLTLSVAMPAPKTMRVTIRGPI